VIIRIAASEQDVAQALEVYQANEPPWDKDFAKQTLEHWLATYASCPEGFWIAEDEQADKAHKAHKIVGVASAIRRPPQWLLTNFFVHPDYHGQGIGKALLERAIAVHEGCERFIVHASQHPSAQRLYMQHGMYPLPYSILFKGQPQTRINLPSELKAEACLLDNALPTLNALDLNALGYTRAVDHHWWAKHGSYFLVKTNVEGQVVGYFAISSRNSIGPLVVSDVRWMAGTLDLAIHQQMALSAADHEIFIPGANTIGIERALAYGYRYCEIELLLSSHPMPGLAQVVFHDTDFL